MNKSPTRQKLPKHTAEEPDNLISLIPTKGIEFVAKKFLNKAWCSCLWILSYTEERNYDNSTKLFKDIIVKVILLSHFMRPVLPRYQNQLEHKKIIE